MNERTKQILKIVAVVLITVFVGFYIFKIRSGGRKAASFVSLNYKWGVGDTLQNAYNSTTGEYQFIDKRDSLIKENFKLRINNIIYLHSKINEGKLLDIPDTIANNNLDLNNKEILRFEFDFVYQDTVRKVLYLSNYNKDPQIAEKARQLQKVVEQIIYEAEERFVSN